MSTRAKRSTAKKADGDAAAAKKTKTGLAVGDELPEFSLENDAKASVTSAELVKDNGIVLFAYPKANTKGCTSQAVGLSEKAAELEAAGYRLYGISADKPDSQAKWKTKEAGITCTLLCDPSYEALGKLGFTKGPKKIERSHIVVAKGGKVLAVAYGVTPKASIKDAVEFCLANKGDTAEGAGAADDAPPAEQAEKAAAAGEAAEAAEAADEPMADAEADAAPAAEEQADAPQAEEPAKEEEAPKAEQEEKAEEEQAPAEEAPAPAAAAAAEAPVADAPAAEEPAAEAAAAVEPAAAEPAAAEPAAPESVEAAAPAAAEDAAAAEPAKPAEAEAAPAAAAAAAEPEPAAA